MLAANPPAVMSRPRYSQFDVAQVLGFRGNRRQIEESKRRPQTSTGAPLLNKWVVLQESDKDCYFTSNMDLVSRKDPVVSV